MRVAALFVVFCGGVLNGFGHSFFGMGLALVGALFYFGIPR